MVKCDMCYDRTSVGKKPMCATVCPSQALFYGTAEEIQAMRPRSRPLNAFRFGGQTITTRVRMMFPRGGQPDHLDVLAAMDEGGVGRLIELAVIAGDPFGEVT